MSQDTRNLTLRTLDVLEALCGYAASGATDPAPVLDALRSHLESVAHHHLNVAGFSQPELDFAP